MADYTSSSSSLLDDTPIISAAGGGSSSVSAFDDAFEDACSICLEPFTTQNPSTATNCKHEYHLQCILEWSQRSKECPICWQLIVMNDPACQELLAAVETERLIRSRTSSSIGSIDLTHLHEDSDEEQDSYTDDFDIDEHIMQQLAAVESRAHYIHRRERQRSSGQGPSQALIFPSLANVPSALQMHASAEESRDRYIESLRGNSPTPLMELQPLPSMVPPVVNVTSSTAVSRYIPSKPRVFFRQQPTDALQTPSEILSFSEIKSKMVAASARYKESISKSTRDIKEKLLGHNNSVKELSKGIQREMSAGIAGVARMIERLDLNSKRTEASSPLSGSMAGTPDHFLKGKGMEYNVIAQALDRKSEGNTNLASLDALSHVSPIPGELEVPRMKRGD